MCVMLVTSSVSFVISQAKGVCEMLCESKGFSMRDRPLGSLVRAVLTDQLISWLAHIFVCYVLSKGDAHQTVTNDAFLLSLCSLLAVFEGRRCCYCAHPAWIVLWSLGKPLCL